MQTSYYLKKMKEDFSRRTRGNRPYSLRAYARDLGVHPSTLSQILLGKRPLPLKNADQVMDRLMLNPRQRTLFRESLGKRHLTLDSIQIGHSDDRFILDETYFQIIAEWEHYAVLTLFDCEEFDGTPNQISQLLNISSSRAEVVIENLLRCGLLQHSKTGTLVTSHPRVRTTEDIASQALRASHRETLEIGARKLNEIPVELRDFSSMMIALDPESLDEAKIIIREFRQKMTELFRPARKTAVYQLAIQFYPLTKVGKGKEV